MTPKEYKEMMAHLTRPSRIKVAQLDNVNTPDLDQTPDSILKPGETLEDFDVTFRRPNADGGRIGFSEGTDNLTKAEKIAQGLEKKRVSTKVDTYLDALKEKDIYIRDKENSLSVFFDWVEDLKMEKKRLKEDNRQLEIMIETKEKDHEKWENMVAEETLGGIQLFADKDWESQFVKDYYISGIPRFILIDPEGKIVSPDAPRPSNPKLKEMLKEKLM
mgnify:CR=1 FL=1